MHVSELKAREFRRFSDLTIRIAGSPKLVVLCGPNGRGKSSVFDAMRIWHAWRGTHGWDSDDEYWVKGGQKQPQFEQIDLSFHEADEVVQQSEMLKKAIYIRTAYRNDPAFEVTQIVRSGALLDAPLQTARRSIDNDVRVSENYQRLVALTLEDVYGGQRDTETVAELRDRYIAVLRNSMLELFPDLELRGPGDPLAGGTFRFKKGNVDHFPYKNLSGGEKAAFDLLLDLLVKREAFDDTVVCIDEPEAHLNALVHGPVLKELLGYVNDRSQLWIATHSIGMMRYARDLHREQPDAVAFLDFYDSDFDERVTIEPTNVDREFWIRTLDVALGDLATLVAPSTVVLCEGKPLEGDVAKAEFDARCYRNVFGDAMPEIDFVSVGNSGEVQRDYLRVGAAISTVVTGTTVVRVIDRDHRSPQEVEDLTSGGFRVLSRRHLESFLLDDEVLVALCDYVDQPGRIADVQAAKAAALAASVGRGNDSDDVKSSAGEFYVSVRKILSLSQYGNSKEAFLADILAPLIRPGMTVYEELRNDLFGS
jgi:hypothetical protein